MSTPMRGSPAAEMVIRVAAALVRLSGTGALDSLASDWRDVVGLLGAGHPFAVLCLLALVRVAWGDETLCVQYRGGVSRSVHAWLLTTDNCAEHYGKGHWTGVDEVEALLAALAAAPAKADS